MGCGKTVQTIAFLRWLKYNKEGANQARLIDVAGSDEEDDGKPKAMGSCETEILPHVVIAPSSVLSNWEREFAKVAPDLNVVKYHGSMTAREDLREEIRSTLRSKTRAYGSIDVILAPITYFQTEKGDDRLFLRKFQYEYMVVDEAHLLKNPRGTRYKSLDRFSTRHRL